MKNEWVLNIGREFGSGGREIGKLAAERLGIPYYDKELIILAAEKSGMSLDYLLSLDEQSVSSFLYSFSGGGSFPLGGRLTGHSVLPAADQLFLSQSEVLRDIAQKGGAVFVGRCADYILQNHPKHMNVFIQAPLSQRIKRVMERHDLTAKAAETLINKTDKNRASYYLHFTGEKWGDRKNFDLVISSAIGIHMAVDLIVDFYQECQTIGGTK